METMRNGAGCGGVLGFHHSAHSRSSLSLYRCQIKIRSAFGANEREGIYLNH